MSQIASAYVVFLSASNPDPGRNRSLAMERLIIEESIRVVIMADNIPMANSPADWLPSKPPALSPIFLDSDPKNQAKAPTVIEKPTMNDATFDFVKSSPQREE